MIGSLRRHAFSEVASARPRRQYRESDDQKLVVAWLRGRPDWLVMRLENAQKRSPAAAARDKALGMAAGAPDLVLIFKQRVIFLEMKKIDGKVSDMQHALHDQLRRRGQLVIVGYGHADAIEKLTREEQYLQP